MKPRAAEAHEKQSGNTFLRWQETFSLGLGNASWVKLRLGSAGRVLAHPWLLVRLLLAQGVQPPSFHVLCAEEHCCHEEDY